jgi:hypothetical protein
MRQPNSLSQKFVDLRKKLIQKTCIKTASLGLKWSLDGAPKARSLQYLQQRSTKVALRFYHRVAMFEVTISDDSKFGLDSLGVDFTNYFWL